MDIGQYGLTKTVSIKAAEMKMFGQVWHKISLVHQKVGLVDPYLIEVDLKTLIENILMAIIFVFMSRLTRH